jgi:hypothetical protein
MRNSENTSHKRRRLALRLDQLSSFQLRHLVRISRPSTSAMLLSWRLSTIRVLQVLDLLIAHLTRRK